MVIFPTLLLALTPSLIRRKRGYTSGTTCDRQTRKYRPYPGSHFRRHLLWPNDKPVLLLLWGFPLRCWDNEMLDDKFAFAEIARSFSLSVPKSFKITAPEQVLNFDFSNEKNKYISKAFPTTKCRLNLTKPPIPQQKQKHLSRVCRLALRSPDMQEFHSWKEYLLTVPCEMESHECTAESSAFQVNYDNGQACN